MACAMHSVESLVEHAGRHCEEMAAPSEPGAGEVRCRLLISAVQLRTQGRVGVRVHDRFWAQNQLLDQGLW